jgi:hypothetical protein
MNRPDKKNSKRFDRKTFIVSLLCLTPIAAAATWSFLPSLRSIVAVTKFSQITIDFADFNLEESSVTIKRQIQRHFLDYSVYIPVEDIVIIAPDKKEDNRVESLMTKACGSGSLFVWIPLKISLPFYGEKVHEWCWKPSIQIKK